MEHRHLDRYGQRRDEMRAIFDNGGDRGRLLATFAAVAAAVASSDDGASGCALPTRECRGAITRA